MNNYFTAIILSYRRPWNIQRICETILTVEGIRKIIVSNNNPDVDLTKYLNVADTRLVIINQERHYECIKRFEIASQEDSDFYFSIDDDLFLSNIQIRYLMERTVADPLRPHGCWGQAICRSFGEMSMESKFDANTEIDILNRAYFFSRYHVRSLFALAEQMSLTISNFGPYDDIFLSFSGTKKPMIHAIGWYTECHTSNAIGVALWRERGFAEKRIEMLKKIMRVKHLKI